MNYDVIIVGSGPAGCLAAYYLAKAGLDVLMLEKEKLPRYKPCGGGLPLRAQKMMPFDISESLEFQSDGGIVACDGKLVFRTTTEEPFSALVMRDKFDYFLVQCAVDAGAEILTGCRVTGLEQNANHASVLTTQGIYQTRVVIGADGVNSTMANLCGLLAERHKGIALEAEVGVSERLLARQGRYATFDFSAIPHGYGWVFPKRDHLSVGVFHACNQKIPQIRSYLGKTIETLVDPTDYEIIHLQGHPIPLGGVRTALDHGRVLLTGDAANMADPFFGEGIYYALWSSTIAAEVLLDGWDQPELDLRAYTHRIEQEILPHFDDADKVGRIFYRLPKLSTHVLRRSAYMQEFMFGVISGKYSYHDLYQAITLRAGKILSEVIFHPYKGGKL